MVIITCERINSVLYMGVKKEIAKHGKERRI